MSLLSVQNLNTGYGKKQVLFNVSLDIEEGETVMLIGANGSGKSTLLKAIYRLLPLWKTPDSDSKSVIEFNDNDLLTYKPFELIDKGILYIPQKDELFAGMTVMQNLENSVLHLKDKKVIRERVNEVFEHLPSLYEKRNQPTRQLSGGERKFLSLGMAIADRPRMLMLDEPTAGLAVDKLLHIHNVLEKIKSMGTTLVIVEHRIKELFDFASRVIGITQGELAVEPIYSISNAKQFML